MVRLRLRAVLLLINLVVLTLPLAGIGVLRIYESALVRQTESELIAQGVTLAASYRSTFNRLAGRRDLEAYGLPRIVPEKLLSPGEPWNPRQAQLDLAQDPIFPPPPDAEESPASADDLARAAGAELATIIREAQFVTLAGIRVISPEGIVVATTGEDRGKLLTNHEEVQRALKGEYVTLMRQRIPKSPTPTLDSISRGTRIRVFAAVPILRKDRVLGAVLLVRTPANIRQAIYGKREAFLWGGLALFAAVVLISMFSALAISRPVRALIDQARRAARGERGAITPLKNPGTREIEELSETIASMAKALEDRATYIRNFAAHVSHEFKTPLTAIQGSVELLRDHDHGMSPQERMRFLGMIDTDSKRLERLVTRLLQLARADVMTVQGESADAGAVLSSTAARYREMGLALEMTAPAERLMVNIGPETLDSIVSNLLDNVRHHAGAGAEAKVLCERADAGTERTLKIEVSDNGKGISAANQGRIFEPFFTTARDTGNTGLGLSIIKSLLSAHGGRIELVPAAQGTCFRIFLPVDMSDLTPVVSAAAPVRS